MMSTSPVAQVIGLIGFAFGSQSLHFLIKEYLFPSSQNNGDKQQRNGDKQQRSFTISTASLDEKDEIFRLINLSYKTPEMISPETSFKKTDRLLHPLDGLEGCYEQGRVIKAVDSYDGKIVGAIVWEIYTNNDDSSSSSSSNNNNNNNTNNNSNNNGDINSTSSSDGDKKQTKSIYFGPFSVHPDMQKCGIGTLLMNEVDKIGVQQGCSFVDISVVNVRTDLLPRYIRLGFVEIGRGNFPAPERINKPCYFILLRKSLKK